MAMANAGVPWKALHAPCGLSGWMACARIPVNTPVGEQNVINIIFFLTKGY